MRGPAFIQLTEAGHDGWPFLVNVNNLILVQNSSGPRLDQQSTVQIACGDSRSIVYTVVETVAEISAKLIALAINDA